MSKSIKLKDNVYLSTKGIVHNRKVLADIIYPVGSIYLSVTPTNPQTYYGGTWVQLKNHFLFATNSTSGNKGNEGNGTGTSTGSTILTTNHLPKDMGTIRPLSWKNDTVSGVFSYTGLGGYDRTAGFGSDFGGQQIKLSGGGQGHTHTIPYIEIYVWKRTA